MLDNTAKNDASSPTLFKESFIDQQPATCLSLAHSAERSYSAYDDSSSLLQPSQSSGTSRLFEMIRKETSSEQDEEASDREPEDLTEEEALLFQKLVKLSNNPLAKESTGNDHSTKREARTKSSSTVDSETESQENSQVLSQQPSQA